MCTLLAFHMIISSKHIFPLLNVSIGKFGIGSALEDHSSGTDFINFHIKCFAVQNQCLTALRAAPKVRSAECVPLEAIRRDPASAGKPAD